MINENQTKQTDLENEYKKKVESIKPDWCCDRCRLTKKCHGCSCKIFKCANALFCLNHKTCLRIFEFIIFWPISIGLLIYLSVMGHYIVRSEWVVIFV